MKHSSGKPVLVFCNTRKGCLTAAEIIAKGEPWIASLSRYKQLLKG